jgi:hypothetical protein
MNPVKLGHPPIGIKIAPENLKDYPSAQTYKGISFCDAVRQASDGACFLLTKDSIEVCKWVPVVFGFAEPDPKYDLKVGINLLPFTSSILIAPVDKYNKNYPPDVVLVRSFPEEMKKIAHGLGWENMATSIADQKDQGITCCSVNHGTNQKADVKIESDTNNVSTASRKKQKYHIDRSALSVLRAEKDPLSLKRLVIINKLLAVLSKQKAWVDFTKWLFNKQWTTYVFDLFLDQYLANMSMCRNSTVIPYLTNKVNISYFCTGGIAWGLNNPSHMTCGLPFSLYKKLEWQLEERK